MKLIAIIPILFAAMLIIPAASAAGFIAALPAGVQSTTAPGGSPGRAWPAFNETIPGERNTGQWFTFEIPNVSGYAGVKYFYTVYDAEIRNSYEYRSDDWGQ